MDTLKLGTRGSPLALYQAQAVAALVRERSGITCEIVIITTAGDRLADAALSEVGGKRLFVKEIEDALLTGEIDVAVHSSKDMPAAQPPGLRIGAVLPREDARDAVVLPRTYAGTHALDSVVAHLGRAPRIGTSSVRRSAQLTRLFPGAQFLPVRGNLDTRLRKLDEGDTYDAIVLASAGLKRLDRGARITAALPVSACVPAPGQGIIAVETRSTDARVLAAVAAINDAAAAAALTAERAVVTRLGGGCQMPIGAHAVHEGATLTLTAVVIAINGATEARAEARGSAADAHAIGIEAAEQLLARGAGAILADVQRTQVAPERLHS